MVLTNTVLFTNTVLTDAAVLAGTTGMSAAMLSASTALASPALPGARMPSILPGWPRIANPAYMSTLSVG
jgi:hypothetical protein